MDALNKIKQKFQKDKVGIGLDIGTSALKFCKVKFSKETAQLSDYCLLAIASNSAADEALRTITQRLDAKTVNISLCGPSTIIRYVNFPRMSHDELKKALKFEAQKYIPFSSAEVNLDAAILKSDLADNKMLIAISAVKKDFIAQRLKLLETHGIKVNIADLDSLALMNAFNFNYPKGAGLPKSLALLNIGSAFTNLNILEDGVPLLSRDINIAGSHFTGKIADNFAVDIPAAERMKIDPDREKISEIAQNVESVLLNLAAEIRVSFDYFESQSASSVSKIFLSGGGSLFSGLKDALANILSVEVEYWDPLQHISPSSGLDQANLKSVSGRLAVAVGLALRS